MVRPSFCGGRSMLRYYKYNSAKGEGEDVLNLNTHLFCIRRRKDAAPTRVSAAQNWTPVPRGALDR
jgi:hypothetical protein